MVETLFFLICNVMLSVKASVWQALCSGVKKLNMNTSLRDEFAQYKVHL